MTYYRPDRRGLYLSKKNNLVKITQNYSIELFRPSLNNWPAIYSISKKQPEWKMIFPINPWPYIVRIPRKNEIEDNPYYQVRLKNIQKLASLYNPIILKSIKKFDDKSQFNIEKLISFSNIFTLQLVRINPFLVFIIANARMFYYKKLNSNSYPPLMRRLLTKSWPQILTNFMFPCSKSLARSFSKISAKTIDLYLINRLQWFFHNTENYNEFIHQLSRLFTNRKISRGILFLLTSQYRDFFTDSFIYEISKDKHNRFKPYSLFIINDIFRMEEICNDHKVSSPRICQFKDLNYVQNLHEEFSESILTIEYGNVSYPEYPYLNSIDIPGLEIKQILNPHQLKQEAKELKHCIFSYHNELAHKENGRYFVFKIYKPERLTILIEKSEKTCLREVRGKHNSIHSIESMHLIRKWTRQIQPPNVNQLEQIELFNYGLV